MTAEIAIMNKEAVALAADSAVTTGTVEGKIFNSANKLFPLGRDHSVGMMIYQDAELMGVPLETIIKIYRDRALGKKPLKTLKSYANNFIRFLNNANNSFNDLFSESEQGKYFDLVVSYYFESTRDRIIDLASKQKTTNKRVARKKIRAITENTMQAVLNSYTNRLKSDKKYQAIANNYLPVVERRYKKIIREAGKRIFKELPISHTLQKTVDRIAIASFATNYLDPQEFFDGTGNYSGVVIAGFGEDDRFPSLESYKVGGLVGDRLIYSKDRYYYRDNVIGSENKGGVNKGRIFTFAQEELIQTFLTGIGPSYEKKLVAYFKQKASALCKSIIDTVGNISDDEKGRLQKRIQGQINKEKEAYRTYIWDLGFDRRIPIEAVIVPALPKDELALMAETLVSLASFERRVSPGRETVGGPIDVAVISKVDGFIWVKKKSYFTPEINPDYYEGR